MPCFRRDTQCDHERTSGAGWLSSIHSSLAAAAAGRGLAIASVAAALSVAIGLAALFDRRTTPMLALSLAIALIYFIVGQGMGGVLTGTGTDPGTGPLLILLAVSVYPVGDRRHRTARPAHPRDAAHTLTVGANASVAAAGWTRQN